MDSKTTVVAFYLPQFHPIAENDTWWGRGFTEWRNVTRALPQFEGHVQPRLPGELGFYDLRLATTVHRQVQLAKQYGIGAFCFYAYWFQGRRVLERPLDAYLADPKLDLPFCLCWANEPWTRRWDGRDEETLLQQQHSASDDLAFIASLSAFLRDPRYLRVDGKPLVIVYRVELLPDPAATAERWRSFCRETGLGEIHLACVESFQRTDPRRFGFDTAIEFPPNLTQAFGIDVKKIKLNPDHRGDILDWRGMSQQFQNRKLPAYPLFRGVNPGWDNEPRRPGRGRSFVNNSVRGYERWLREAIASAGNTQTTDRLVFVNAWNEWAEGAYLEPDARFGYAWLEATHRAQRPPQALQVRPCAVIHAYYPELLAELLDRLVSHGGTWRVVITTSYEHRHAVKDATSLWSSAAGPDKGSLLAIEIRAFENRGRDILPFLRVADELIDEGEDVVLKLHTKRSPHLSNGGAWRSQMLDALVPAGRRAMHTAFGTDAKLGLVGPSGHALSTSQHLGGNVDGVAFLQRQLGTSADMPPGLFFAGSMYWIRLKALQALIDLHLDELLFEEETGQVDGTLAHAIERITPVVVHASGYRIAETRDPMSSNPVCVETAYPFLPSA